MPAFQSTPSPGPFTLPDIPPLKPGWLMGLGLALIVLGALAWIDAMMTTLTSVIIIGALLVVAGILQLFQAFAHNGATTGSKWLSALGGVLYILCGFMVIDEPVTGSVFFTAVIAGLLIISGVARAMWASQHRYLYNWWTGLVSGLVSIVLGILIYVTLPWSGLWLLGTLIGIELIFVGITMLTLGLAGKRLGH